MVLHDHAHAAEHGSEASPRTRALLSGLVGLLVAATAFGLVALWPSDGPSLRTGALGQTAERERAAVLDVRRDACIGAQPGADGGPAPTCPTARVELTTGPHRGEVVDAIVPEGEGTPAFRAGDDVVVAFVEQAPEGQQYQVVDFQRGQPLLLLAGIFAALVVIAGRWRGLAALAGLGVSAVVLLTFVVPAVLAGESPLPVAIVGASAIMLVSLFLVHGFTARTAVAVLGTAGSLAVIGVLAFVFVALSRFTGLGSEDVAYLRSVYGEIDLRGLLLAGVVIGSLGVLDDMTVTQTSVVWEIAHTDPGASRRQVYRAAARVGRDHVASVVNTLVLAYAGASLPLLLLFSVSGADSGDVLTTELVAVEIVRTLVGGIGVVAAAPLTTALATMIAVSDRGIPAARGGRRSRRKPARARVRSSR